MTERRMKSLLMDLDIPAGSVYIPDTDKILKGVKERIEIREKRSVIPFRFVRIVSIAAVIVLIMALATVAFGQGGVWRKIFTFFEVPTEAAEEEVTEKVFENVIIYEPETETETEPETVPTEVETKITKKPDIPTKSPLVNKYFDEEPSEAEEYLQEIEEGVGDENYQFTVNEILGDAYNVYLVVTLTAKTQEAKDRLMVPEFASPGMDVEMFTDGRWMGLGGGYSELPNLRRENSKSFSLHFSNIYSDGGIEGRIACKWLDLPEEERYIYFEVSSGLEEIALSLYNQAFEGGSLTLTPMGIVVTLSQAETLSYAPDARNLEIFFRFKNGELKTFNQLFSFDTSMRYVNGTDNPKLYQYVSSTKKVMDLNSLESIIVKGVEYPIANPESYFAAYVPDNLKPFKINKANVPGDIFLFYPCYLKEILSGLGAQIQTEEVGHIEFTLWGNTYSVTAGQSDIYVNSERAYIMETPILLDSEDRIIVGYEFVRLFLELFVDEINDSDEYLLVP